MSLRINTNIGALNAHRNLSFTTMGMQKSLERLSSGFRINRAGDDAAGLAISERMRGQVRGLQQAGRNAADGVSLVQTAEGAMHELHSILQRFRELIVQAGTGTVSDSDRANIQDELDALIAEVDRIATATDFNGVILLDGTFSSTFLVGESGAAAEQITVTVGDLQAAALSVDTIDVSVAGYDATAAAADLTTLDAALTSVSSERAGLGATQNRLEHTIANLSVQAENLAAAESRIRDADMALEMVSFTKHQILVQAGTAMVAQANTLPQAVLQLLR